MNASLRSDFDLVHKHIEEITPKVIRPPSGWLKHLWITPSWGPPYNVCQFSWDAFHQCLRFLYDGKPELFKFMIENHLEYQQPDGWMPLAIHHELGFGVNEESAFQPFLAQGALLYTEHARERSWVEGIYDKIRLYLNFWEDKRGVADNLYCWWGESGCDNDVVSSFFRPRSVGSVSASALMWMEYQAMSKIAACLNKTEDAVAFIKKADAIREAINHCLWSNEYGCYANINLRTRKPIIGLGLRGLPGEAGTFSFMTWNTMLALYPGLAPAARAKSHIERYLLNPEHFWSPYGIRSLSARSEYYNNAIWGNPPRYSNETNMTASNWQGPVWVPVNYFIFHALLRYGYKEKAEELADTTIRLLARGIKAKGYMSENYNAETGEDLYAPKFASWNMLADVMHKELAMGTSLLFRSLEPLT